MRDNNKGGQGTTSTREERECGMTRWGVSMREDEEKGWMTMGMGEKDKGE
jgi:hypothetical protein